MFQEILQNLWDWRPVGEKTSAPLWFRLTLAGPDSPLFFPVVVTKDNHTISLRSPKKWDDNLQCESCTHYNTRKDTRTLPNVSHKAAYSAPAHPNQSTKATFQHTSTVQGPRGGASLRVSGRSQNLGNGRGRGRGRGRHEDRNRGPSKRTLDRAAAREAKAARDRGGRNRD